VNVDRVTSAHDSGNAQKALLCRRCGYQAIVIGLLPSCPMCQATAWDELDGDPTRANAASESPTARPTWETVEHVLAELSTTKNPFTGISNRTYRLERYHRGWRVLAVSESSSRWVDVEDIRGCWETFQRLGRIQREDVLDPGRCAAFMMALFEQVPGIEQTAGGNSCLTFA
jgi:hypothetical protein